MLSNFIAFGDPDGFSLSIGYSLKTWALPFQLSASTNLLETSRSNDYKYWWFNFSFLCFYINLSNESVER